MNRAERDPAILADKVAYPFKEQMAVLQGFFRGLADSRLTMGQDGPASLGRD